MLHSITGRGKVQIFKSSLPKSRWARNEYIYVYFLAAFNIGVSCPIELRYYSLDNGPNENGQYYIS